MGPTAVFVVWLLGQRLTLAQWSSLPLLVVGVVLVTLNKAQERSRGNSDWQIGVLASSLGGLSSAYAAVYFEMYVKGKHGTCCSLWIRNLQLSLFGLPLSIAYALVKDQVA